MINDSPILIRLCGAQYFVVNKYYILQNRAQYYKEKHGQSKYRNTDYFAGEIILPLMKCKNLADDNSGSPNGKT